jgi:hypothetical protein
MRFRHTLVLGLIFFALGAYVYFVEFERAAEERKKETLFDLMQDDVDEVVLSYPDREITLIKATDKWKIIEPIQAPADQLAAKNLVRAIAECEVTKRLDDVPEDLEPFGLLEPDVVIRVKRKGEALPEIRVGKNTPVGYSTYIQRADNPKVMLTESAFHSGMQKEVEDLRDKTIVEFNDDEVRKIAVVAPDRNLLLARSNDKWKIEQPSEYNADESRVRNFLSTLRSSRATGFPDENPADLEPYGLASPRLQVTLFLGEDEERKEILVGGEAGDSKIYLKSGSRPTIYEANDWVYRDLNKNLNDFRDKTILPFDKDAVTSVEVHGRDPEAFELQKVGEKAWALVGGTGEVDAAKADQFVSDLQSLDGYEIAADEPEDLSAYGLASPEFTLTLRGKNETIGTMYLGTFLNENGEKNYSAMADGTATVFLVRDYLYKRTAKNVAHFLVPQVPTQTISPETDKPEAEEEA